MKHGGRRLGAGRKKGSYTSSKTLKRIVEAEARSILVEQVLKRWEPIVKTLVDLALGKVKGQKGYPDYVINPDQRLLVETIYSVIGKPKGDDKVNLVSPEMVELAHDVRAILNRK